MWEVDPETKSKLAKLQHLPPNKTCIDCGAPSPQWASPKFGTFICLTCAGLHRSLGVHISFVRSIQMDSFKAAEIKRMELGGNSAWKDFWEEKTGKGWGRPGEGGGREAQEEVGKRYGGDVGEEWKERLGCLVEGREFAGMPPKERKTMEAKGTDASTARTESPLGQGPQSRKEQNEEFFARKGNENASRPDGLAPSQGGKYAGFGSEPMPARNGGGAAGQGMPGVNDFQQDPMKALSKGFWGFAGAVGKGAKAVNEGYIQPTAQKVGSFLFILLCYSLLQGSNLLIRGSDSQVAESDFTHQARATAQQAARSIQTGTKGAADRFNDFVEGAGDSGGGRARAQPKPERQDFWDSFGEAGKGGGGGSSSIGTSAMRKGGEGKRDEGWGNDW
ncbi:ADP-ribosylation factor GTPase-activating protein gcs1 [Lecanora helva]